MGVSPTRRRSSTLLRHACSGHANGVMTRWKQDHNHDTNHGLPLMLCYIRGRHFIQPCAWRGMVGGSAYICTPRVHLKHKRAHAAVPSRFAHEAGAESSPVRKKLASLACYCHVPQAERQRNAHTHSHGMACMRRQVGLHGIALHVGHVPLTHVGVSTA